jgi:NAD(P)-dependent dehydrogenase (short-subunit alcohol dehydrogenase family)
MHADGVALVTGASRGIGRAVALELAGRGFDVVAAMRDPHDGVALARERAAGSGAIAVRQLDVTRPETIEMPERLRVLVNNAGVEFENLPVEETPMDRWREQFETNVFGLVEVTRRAIGPLRRAGGGVICNITSSSLLVPMPFFASYRASKAAVSALGESLRAELAPFDIRIVEVLPGAIDTDMLARSSVVPDAVAFPAYQPQAELVGEARRGMAGTETPTAAAATAIVDAILDDHAPMRVSCDPLGAGLLESWRASDDETVLRGFIDAFVSNSERPADGQTKRPSNS